MTWKLVFVLLWVLVFLHRNNNCILTPGSVVELTVAVICSCLTCFPGFFRYLMPLIRSMGSRLSSTLKSLHLTKFTLRSNAPSSNEKLGTGNMKITLGSRVDGKGHFLNPKSIFGTTQRSSDTYEVDHDPSPPALKGDQTRRAHHEYMAEARWAQKYPPASDDTRFAQTNASWATYQDAELGLPTRTSVLDDAPELVTTHVKYNILRSLKVPSRSDHARKGYWNFLSIFDSIATRSTKQSGATSKADSSSS